MPDITARFHSCPPIVQAAILALLEHEEKIQRNEQGYELQFYIEDLPNVVWRAIEPWDSLP